MNKISSKRFHKLYGQKKTRICYQNKDFFDYLIMMLLCMIVIYVAYGENNIVSYITIPLCAVTIAVFIMRHGFKNRIPLIIRKPQEILFTLLYKIENIKAAYLLALGVLLLENYLIFLTPNWPHHVDLMRNIGFILFYVHLLLITGYRTVIFISHIKKRELAREVLMQAPFWKNYITKRSNILLEVVHAYITGLLTHVITIAPWYMVIKYLNFSVIFLPAVVILNFYIYKKFYQVVSSWFYRDHWVGHNSEFEFLYFHGTHHDTIPSGMIAVAGNGHLEGFMRHVMGFPNAMFNPVAASILYTIEIHEDMVAHQYIPGIFPKPPREHREVVQHSTHHFGQLEPYGFSFKLDQPGVSEETKRKFRLFPSELVNNSSELDENLTGFKWDNHKHKWYLDLIDKYQK